LDSVSHSFQSCLPEYNVQCAWREFLAIVARHGNHEGLAGMFEM
jgi:hypothetical protein